MGRDKRFLKFILTGDRETPSEGLSRFCLFGRRTLQRGGGWAPMEKLRKTCLSDGFLSKHLAISIKLLPLFCARMKNIG